MQRGCNAFKGDRPESKPLSIQTRNDELEYITRYKIPYCKEIYGDIIEENGIYNTTLIKGQVVFIVVLEFIQKKNLIDFRN